MKKTLLSLCVMLLAGAGLALAQTKTIYAEITDNGDGTGNRTLTIKAMDGTPTYSQNDGIGIFQVNSNPAYTRQQKDTALITKVVIDESMKNAQPTTTSRWFQNLRRMTSIEGLDNLNTSEVTDMSYMFYNCTRMPDIHISGWNDEEKLTTTSHMFANCKNITTDSYLFPYTSIKDMSYMFDGCSNLKWIHLDCAQITNLRAMVRDCTSLVSFDINDFGPDVTDMSEMFSGCSSLKEIEFPNDFNSIKVTDMHRMFYNCEQLATFDFGPNFFTNNVTDMSEMFSGCDSLVNLNEAYRGFVTEKVTDMHDLFKDCFKLKSLDLTTWNTTNVEDMSGMFSGCMRLKSLKVFPFTTNATDMSSMFYLCGQLESIDGYMNMWDTSNVTDMSKMFMGCSNFKTIDVSNFNTSNVENMSEMFDGCSHLTSLSVKNFDTQNVTNMSGMFSNLTLESIDVSNFKTGNVEDFSHMFYDCSNLKSLDVSNFTFKEGATARGFALSCHALRVLNLGDNDLTNYVTDGTLAPWETFGGVGSNADVWSDPVGTIRPCRLIYNFDISSLGRAYTEYQPYNDGYSDEGTTYGEMPPYHKYLGGFFTIADTLDCSKSYEPADTKLTDLWQYDRNMKAGQWNTLFVPVPTLVKTLKSINYIGEVCAMDSYDGETLKFTDLDDDETIPAHTPVLVKPTRDIKNLCYTNIQLTQPTKTLVSTEKDANGYYATFYGCYEYGKKLDRSCYYYNYATGKFVRSHGNSFCDTTRGYFKFFHNDKEDSGEAKQFVIDDDGISTSITNIDGEPVGKAEGNVYNLSGQRVGHDYKGIVIVGGKKIIRK